MSRIHANNFGTTIAADITNVATTITLSSTTGLPAIGAGVTANLTLQSGSDIEIVTATALSGSDITVTRAQEGTSAMPFASGSSISLRPTADSIDRKADGASSSTDNAIARFDSTSGKILQNSVVTVGDTGDVSGVSSLTASDHVSIGGNSTAAGYAEFLEDSDNGSNKVTLTAPSSLAGDATVTLPSSTGTLALTTSLPNTFSTIQVSGQSDVVADSTSDTLTLVAGSNVTITTNAGSDSITIASTGGGGGGTLADGDYGDVTVSSTGTVITIDTPSSATVANDDKVLIKDTSASDVMKYVTTQSIRDLVPGSGTLTSAQLATALTDETGSGANVFATSPTLVTPILGTPTSGTLSNCTGLPIGGISGLGTNVGTFLGTPSSANLASAVTDETGSGALVFANSPTLVTPALGTPASGVLTNCTGLPVAGGGTGVSSVTTSPTASSFAGWDSSSNLSANNFLRGYASTATAAGTTTLTVTSAGTQVFTGSTTQTVTMPAVTTLSLGTTYTIVNLSSGVVTVQSSGANTVQAMAANTTLVLMSNATSGTGAAVWTVVTYTSSASDITGSGSLVRATSPTLTTPTLGVASATSINFGGGALSNYVPLTSFTPVIEGSSTAGTGTYSVQVGRYMRIGSMVHASLRLTWSAHTGTGNMVINGLPVAMVNVSGLYSSAAIYFNNIAIASGEKVILLVVTNTTTINCYKVDNGAASPLALDTAGEIVLAVNYPV
jgi:hypothetical protein